MKGKLIFSVLAVLISVIFTTSGLRAEDEINVYLGFSREVNEALVKKIKEKTGIVAKGISLSWGEIGARVRMEAPRFNADMIWSVGATVAIDCAQRGYFETYKSPIWDDIDAAFKSPDNSYYVAGNMSFLLLGNKERLAKKGYGMPMSYKNLLDPKWKGEIVVSSPRTSGTAYLVIYSMFQLYGEKEGWKFLEALDKNVAFYTKSGNAPTELVGRGEYLLGLAADENVLPSIQRGYPIQWVVPVEGIGYEGNCVSIFKGTKKLALCKKVIDYLGTKDASEFLASWGYIAPRPVTSSLYGAITPEFIKLDHAWAVKNKRRIVKLWKRKFLMKETPKARKVGDEKERKAAEEAKKKQ